MVIIQPMSLFSVIKYIQTRNTNAVIPHFVLLSWNDSLSVTVRPAQCFIDRKGRTEALLVAAGVKPAHADNALGVLLVR